MQQQQQWQQRLLHSMSEGRRLRGPQPNQTQQIRVFSHDGSAEQLQEVAAAAVAEVATAKCGGCGSAAAANSRKMAATRHIGAQWCQCNAQAHFEVAAHICNTIMVHVRMMRLQQLHE